MNATAFALAGILFGPPHEWNGLGAFQETALEARVELLSPNVLNWNALDTDIPLLILASATFADDDMRGWVMDGGKVIGLDEGVLESKHFLVGRSDSAETMPPHSRLYMGQPHLPQICDGFEPDIGFNLGAPSSCLVGNHPVEYALPSDSPWKPVVTFTDGAGAKRVFAAERSLGRGKILQIGDASILINEMQALHGNKQFVANILRRHCSSEPCRAYIVPTGEGLMGPYVRRKARSREYWLQNFSSALQDALHDRDWVMRGNGLGLLFLVFWIAGRAMRERALQENIKRGRSRVLGFRNTGRARAARKGDGT